jgi:30S ribosomal protein S31
MGKGDKKTRRGKIVIGTYGVRRPKKLRNTPDSKTLAASQMNSEKKKEVAVVEKEKKKVTKKVTTEAVSEEKPTVKKKSTGKSGSGAKAEK